MVDSVLSSQVGNKTSAPNEYLPSSAGVLGILGISLSVFSLFTWMLFLLPVGLVLVFLSYNKLKNYPTFLKKVSLVATGIIGVLVSLLFGHIAYMSLLISLLNGITSTTNDENFSYLLGNISFLVFSITSLAWMAKKANFAPLVNSFIIIVFFALSITGFLFSGMLLRG